jgi:hypothetical protein
MKICTPLTTVPPSAIPEFVELRLTEITITLFRRPMSPMLPQPTAPPSIVDRGLLPPPASDTLAMLPAAPLQQLLKKYYIQIYKE